MDKTTSKKAHRRQHTPHTLDQQTLNDPAETTIRKRIRTRSRVKIVAYYPQKRMLLKNHNVGHPQAKQADQCGTWHANAPHTTYTDSSLTNIDTVCILLRHVIHRYKSYRAKKIVGTRHAQSKRTTFWAILQVKWTCPNSRPFLKPTFFEIFHQ